MSEQKDLKELIREVLLAVHPVGSLFFTSDDRNPDVILFEGGILNGSGLKEDLFTELPRIVPSVRLAAKKVIPLQCRKCRDTTTKVFIGLMNAKVVGRLT